MSRRVPIFTCIAIFICILAFSFALAGNRSGKAPATGGAGKGDMQTDQLRLREEKQLMDQECENDALQTRDRLQEYEKEDGMHYTSQDGKTYEWKRRYTKQAQKYEEKESLQALHRYLYRIAHRYRFQYEQDIDGFVQWAEKHKPWNSQ